MASSPFPTVVQSSCIYYNAEDITGVQAEVTSSGNIRFWVGRTDTLDSGIVWEELTNDELTGTSHVFTATGQYIYWKAIGDAGLATITGLKIKVLR